MIKDNLSFVFENMEASDSLKSYLLEKLEKKERLYDDIIKARATYTSLSSHKGESEDFKLDIDFDTNDTRIRVSETGEDMYAVIDFATDKLFRRLKRYMDKKSQWEGVKPWKVIEADNMMADHQEVDKIDDFVEFVPKVTEKRNMKSLRPMEEAEAIERMELSGYCQFLFKNKNEDNKFCVVYRTDYGGYGLVVPENGDLE